MAFQMKALIAPLVACNVLGLFTTAHAQAPCGDRDTAIQSLFDDYGEVVRVRAISKGGELLEVLVNEESGSYTVLVTRPGGPTCGVDSGYNFTLIAPEPKGEGA